MIRLVVCLALLLTATACDPLDKPDPGAPDRPTCAGASLRQALAADDPHVWRGVVSAHPAAPAAAPAGAWLLDRLIPSAHAMVMPGEQPVAGARVVAAHDAQRVEAVTDDLGRYCLRVPEAWGNTWTLQATTPQGLTLRAIPDLPAQADINAQTEAMHQLFAQEGLDPTALTPTQRLNLHTMADSALGLLRSPPLPEVQDAARAIEQARDALRQDARFMQALAAARSK